MDVIRKYFSDLSSDQINQFTALGDLYTWWNKQVNVISRKDVEHLYLKHVLHSLAISKLSGFADNTNFLDIGTGGGFPGIPLAIMFPKCNFYLVDSIGKKIKIVTEICSVIGLTNVRTEHARVEALAGKYDFITARAVKPVPMLYNWTRKLISSKQHNKFANGWLLLKGGDLREELAGFKGKSNIFELSDYFDEEFFIGKKLLHLVPK
ncbi:16S rRNA (guanine(527)-N(7))-methyltransferase RsmG [bacterium AH-315-C07]|nr:16S rRNA (guanine(527)-N(7))-methyltransferase RsmG [bacterium AH-315-C07]